MKKLILIFSLTTCFSMAAQFSPVKDPRGFIGGYFKGQNCVFTNVSLNLANGTTYGVFDEFGGFIFTDYAGNQRFVWDPSSDDWSFIATNGTVKIEVDHNSKLTLNNPFLVGTITGNGSGLSNAVDLIAGSNITITTNANKRSYTISASAGAGSGTFDYAQLTNVPVRIGTLATNNAGQALTNLMGGISINSIPVETADGGLITTAATITGSGGDTITVPFLVGSSALTVGTNSIRNVGSSINGIGLTNGSLTVPGNINMAGTFNVGALNATNFVVTNPWNAANATNIQATNILSTFSLGNIAGGFGGNSFWLGKNAVLIGENFSGAAFDSRLAAATAQGGSSAFIGNPSGMSGSSTWRLSSYPTNTGSYAVIRYAPSGSPGINFSNRFCMDTSLMMGRVDLLQLSVGAVSDAITIATTDSIRWLANTNWSANWIAECTSNSVSSYFTSSIPWAIDAKMMFSIDCTPTAARFYTNGILATTITTNIPVGRAVTPALRTMATANTGAATISSTYFDYVWVLIH